MFHFSRNKLFVAYQLIFVLSGRIRWNQSVALTLLTASVLFGRVTSSLMLEASRLKRINQGWIFLMRLKLEQHALLVRTCDVCETAYPGSLVSKPIKKVALESFCSSCRDKLD